MLKKVVVVLAAHVQNILYMLPVFVVLFGAGLVTLLIFGRFTDVATLMLLGGLAMVFLIGYKFISPIIIKFVPKPTLILLIFLLGLVGWTFWNVNYSSQHVYSDRDPATYLLTAAYLQDSTKLTYDVPVEVQGLPGVTAESPGFAYLDESQTELSAQGMHMLPALGAVTGRAIGELRINSVNVLIGSVALLAFFSFIRLYLSDKWALLASVVLAVSLPFIYFSRDFYSEILSVLTLFVFLNVVYFAHKSKSLILWLIAGFCLGALPLIRIDGFMIVAATFFAILASIARANKKDRGYAYAAAATLILATAVVATVGMTDIFVFNPNYFEGEGRDELMVNQFWLLGGATLVGLLFAQLGHFKRFNVFLGSPQFRRTLIVILALFFIVVLTRPIWLKTYGARQNEFVESIQEAQDHIIEPTRTYAEFSVEWVGWYIGTPFVYIGLFVAIWLFATYFRKGFIDKLPLTILSIIVLLNAGIYFIMPKVSPDQIWGVRRFLPVVIPGVIFFTVFALQFIEKRFSRLVRPNAVFGFSAALAIIPSLIVSAPFFWVGEQQRMGALVKVCQAIPKNSVVLWLSQAGNELLMATNIYCDVPAVAFKDKGPREVPEDSEIKAVQNEVTRRGKQLYIGFYDSFHDNLLIANGEVNAPAVVSYEYNELERTIYSVPRYTHEREQTIFLGGVNKEGNITNHNN